MGGPRRKSAPNPSGKAIWCRDLKKNTKVCAANLGGPGPISGPKPEREGDLGQGPESVRNQSRTKAPTLFVYRDMYSCIVEKTSIAKTIIHMHTLGNLVPQTKIKFSIYVFLNVSVCFLILFLS